MRRARGLLLGLAVLAAALPGSAAAIDWSKMLRDLGVGGEEKVTVASLGEEEVAAALKEALSRGAERAIDSLSRVDGYFGNPRVRIPMPGELSTVESALRTLGQDRYADRFVLTMNRAAEAAAGEASAIVAEAVRRMTVVDAKEILTGPEDAATRYFRRVGEPGLEQRMLPIVQEATAESGVTSAYKRLVDVAGPAASLVGYDAVELDRYVTGKAIDGIFTLIAAEEKRIRADPVGRGSELLEKVFTATR